MQKIFIISILWLYATLSAPAQDFGLYWKYKDYDPKVAFVAPGWLVKMGVAFIPTQKKVEKRLLRRIGKTRVMVFEEGSPVTARDMQRFEKRAKRRGLEDLLLVRDAGNDIRVMGRTNGSTLRKVVVFVKTPDEFVLVSARCRLRFEEVLDLIKEAPKQLEPKNPRKDIIAEGL